MKKEIYFTSTTIEAKALDILASVESLSHGRHRDQLQLDHAALLVLDMQSYFLDQTSHAYIPSAAAILPHLQKLINVFAAHECPIIFSRHTNSPADAGSMARWWRDLLELESPLSRIVPELDTTRGTLLEKHTYDAFFQTNLEQLLRADNVKRVIITGVMTHLCCETTARSAFTWGFDVLFVVDGTATYTEAFHRATVLNLAHGFALPVLTEEILALFL